MRNDVTYRHVILSGCSGGGKSTLLHEFGRRGFATVEEPGRRIVAAEMRGDGGALPWNDLEAFARRAIDLAARDRAAEPDTGRWIFFDRGLIDAAVALEHAVGTPAAETLAGFARFHRCVFLTPPWPEIYRVDGARPQNIEEGIGEYHRLLAAYERLGYEPVILPKVGAGARADFVLDRLSRGGAPGKGGALTRLS